MPASDTPVLPLVDATVLRPSNEKEIRELFDTAETYGCAAVCVYPIWLPLLTRIKKESPVKLCTVIGFPHGQDSTASKVFSAGDAIDTGANEVDMVIDISAALAGDWRKVEDDVRAVVRAVSANNGIVKTILETALLDDKQIVQATKACCEAGAHYVKTSTGFSTRGASVHDISLMASAIDKGVGIKASGGVRTKEFALQLIDAGATRIGASDILALR